MEKGFSLNSVQINDTGIPIDQTVTFPIPIFTHPAKPSFPLGNMTPPGAEFTLDFAASQTDEIGGELSFNEAFFGHLCPNGFRKTEQVSSGKSAETLPANF